MPMRERSEVQEVLRRSGAVDGCHECCHAWRVTDGCRLSGTESMPLVAQLVALSKVGVKLTPEMQPFRSRLGNETLVAGIHAPCAAAQYHQHRHQ